VPTIWRVPDDLWARMAPILAERDPPKPTGRRRDPRPRGRRCHHLPARVAGVTGISSPETSLTIVRSIARSSVGFSSVSQDQIWVALVKACAELGGVNWEWQAADAAMGKARLGGDHRGPNPTDRGKAGVKRSLLVEAAGGPLGVIVAGANVHDTKLLASTLEAVVVERPESTEEEPQHLCLDKGYDNPTGRETVAAYCYVPHIRRIGEEKLDTTRVPRYPARRWVVERTLAWLNKCRAILVRYDKKTGNYLALIKLACALLWYRRHVRLVVLR
jgi:putative transposase